MNSFKVKSRCEMAELPDDPASKRTHNGRRASAQRAKTNQNKNIGVLNKIPLHCVCFCCILVAIVVVVFASVQASGSSKSQIASLEVWRRVWFRCFQVCGEYITKTDNSNIQCRHHRQSTIITMCLPLRVCPRFFMIKKKRIV